MLTYPPFAASVRMQSAVRSNPPFALHEKGTAVALLQGGLIQQGIPMPNSTKKGVPDGIYGNETLSAVTTFQQRNKFFNVDGIAGKDTITVLDGLLAKATPPLPIIPGPPSSPVNRNYQIGTLDPAVSHDRGAGIWGSKP
ncbi:MAG: hypothetical protein QOI66_2689, partial [Myxococcales bacterium]|nr:hypothetical protein [Myxococcales bacterium]